MKKYIDMKKYIVELTSEERKSLEDLVSKGIHAAYKIKHAHILLKADRCVDNWKDIQIADAFGCHLNTLSNVRRRFVEGVLEVALERQKRCLSSRKTKLDGEAEARLIALCCSEPPSGRSQWSLRMLASKLVELEIVESISPETVRQTLKKRVASPSQETVGNSP